MNRILSYTQEELGQLVRNGWIHAVIIHIPNPPANWVSPYGSMNPTMQKVEQEQGLYLARALGCIPSDCVK